jgi:pimeloyl-ACP methyl ester carboxylesterase
MTQKLKYNNGFIAYNKFSPNKNNYPTIIFLSGFMSNMQGGKAIFLQKLCEERQIPYIRFDYIGTGESSGNIEDGNISLWKDNALKIMELAEAKKVILIGSSMGGWLATLIAQQMPERIASIIGIASAPDFTEKLIWQMLDKNAQSEIIKNGFYQMPSQYCNDPEGHDSGYKITKLLIEDGRKNLILNKDNLKIKCPVTLIHGTEDEDVPYSFSIDLADKIESKDVEIILKKGSKHRMSSPEDLSLLQEVVEKHIIM